MDDGSCSRHRNKRGRRRFRAHTPRERDQKKMADSDDGTLTNEVPRNRSRRSSKHVRASDSQAKAKKSRRRGRCYSDDDDSLSASREEYDRDRKRRKKERTRDKEKKQDKKKKKSRRKSPGDETNGNSPDCLKRNHALANALCRLFDGHPALSSELPIMLIRMAGGASFDLSQMTDATAANGLANAFACLRPFGVEREESTWTWKSPAGGSSTSGNELVLIRVVRALLDQIGVTPEAVKLFENPPAPKARPAKPSIEETTLRGQFASNHAVERQVKELLTSFPADNMANDLAGLCKMIMDGEVIALDGLPDERLRVALKSLFAICGLDQTEMEDDGDGEEDDAAATGYGLPESSNDVAKAMIASVLEVCHSNKRTRASRRPVKGPLLHPEAYDDDPSYSNDDNDSSDADDGPLPVGAAAMARASTLSHEQVKAIAASRARELACAKKGIELDPSDDNVREEWMLVPGKFDFLSAIKSGQPIRSRQFDAKSKAEGADPEQQRVDPVIQAEIHAIKHAFEEARGPSLMDHHRDAKKAAASQRQPPGGGRDAWKWKRDTDLDAGRRVDKDALNMILGGASSDLKNKFQSSL